MKLELAPRHEEQIYMCHQMGSGQQYLKSILTVFRHLEPIVFLPVITTRLLSKTQQIVSVDSVRK